MKSLLALLALALASNSAFAQTTTTHARVIGGYVNRLTGNPPPLGAMVDMESGAVLSIYAVVSVLPPTQLEKGCIYSITFIEDKRILPIGAIKLVPPMKKISCGHDFIDWQ